jgi:hypothetical protein
VRVAECQWRSGDASHPRADSDSESVSRGIVVQLYWARCHCSSPRLPPYCRCSLEKLQGVCVVLGLDVS